MASVSSNWRRSRSWPMTAQRGQDLKASPNGGHCFILAARGDTTKSKQRRSRAQIFPSLCDPHRASRAGSAFLPSRDKRAFRVYDARGLPPLLGAADDARSGRATAGAYTRFWGNLASNLRRPHGAYLRRSCRHGSTAKYAGNPECLH